MVGTRGDLVGVIACEGEYETLASVLAGGDLTAVEIDGPQAGADAPELGAIVWQLEGSITGVSAMLEPLAGRAATDPPVVLVCPEIERWEVRAALAAGAAGVVGGESLERSLVACVRAAQAGQVCVPREHWRQIAPPVLSNREKQILGLVVMGYMNSQIAAQLFLAESTVKSHLSSAFGKLGVRSRNEAVELILNPERGLGMGILALGGEPVEPVGASRR
jgi:DNA-binding NarL/FixJ family response regulator